MRLIRKNWGYIFLAVVSGEVRLALGVETSSFNGGLYFGVVARGTERSTRTDTSTMD